MKWSALGIVLAILVMGYFLFGDTSGRPIRKKITIEIATPGGTAKGASVIELKYSRAPWWYPTGTGNRNSVGVRAEAPYVELGAGRYIFVALNDQLHQAPIWEYLHPVDLSADGSFKRGHAPMLITFSDINDPATIRQVDPGALDATFGPGFRLRALRATDTSDHATQGVLERKFSGLRRALMTPAFYRKPLARPEDFRRGDLANIDWDAFAMRDW